MSEDESLEVDQIGSYEITIDHGDGTETVIDPMVGTYDQSTSPFSDNPERPYEVDIKIQIGVQSNVRNNTHQWRQTQSYTHPFFIETTTLKFQDDIPAVASLVYDHVQSERARGAYTQTRAAVWLDNFTHPPTGAGVVRLPKGHRDVTYTQREFTGADWLGQRLQSICQDLKNTARY